MTAISVTFTPKVAADWDPQKPLTTTKLNQLYNNTQHLREWVGGSYTANAVQDHNHNGVNSALVEVGANMLRNGSFEGSSASWTLTNYTGGTMQVQTSGAMHGKYCLAITSTVLANGGGKLESDEFMPVSPGRRYSASGLFSGSAANLSGAIGIIWYDAALAQISASNLSFSNIPTTQKIYGITDSAPGTAAYARVLFTGIPPGATIGTVYVDGCSFSPDDVRQSYTAAGTSYFTPDMLVGSNTSTAAPYQEVKNFSIQASGFYRVTYAASCVTTNQPYSQIYRNGVAYGTVHSAVAGTFTEDLYFDEGDTMQIFAAPYTAGMTTTISGVGIGALSRRGIAAPVSLSIGQR